VFTAADDIDVAGRRLAGAGIFASRPDRILTLAGATPSTWRMPAWMSPVAGVAKLSYHEDQARWSPIDADTSLLSSASIGQEFVLTTTRPDLLGAWLKGVFSDLPDFPQGQHPSG
jgi:hypothetical protein